MGRREDIRKRINKLNEPSDMKKMAWDWYIFGYEDGQSDAFEVKDDE